MIINHIGVLFSKLLLSVIDMKLEELIKERERKELEELTTALQIAEREWENIKTSLELCGDIGNFRKEDFMVGVMEEDVIFREPLSNPTKSVSGYSPTYYPMYFLSNLLVMDDKMPDLGYKTIEAMYVFIELATQAVSRLGLEGNFAMGFGSGYGYVRSGWLAEKGWAIEREIFYNEFFRGTKINYDWDFFWNSVKEKMLINFNIFKKWKDDPDLYLKETKSKAKVKPLLV